VHYSSNFERTLCTAGNTTESHSAIWNTFENGMKIRNPYHSKNRCRRPEPTLASLLFTRTIYHIHQRQWRQHAGKWACVCGICRV